MLTLPLYPVTVSPLKKTHWKRDLGIRIGANFMIPGLDLTMMVIGIAQLLSYWNSLKTAQAHCIFVVWKWESHQRGKDRWLDARMAGTQRCPSFIATSLDPSEHFQYWLTDCTSNIQLLPISPFQLNIKNMLGMFLKSHDNEIIFWLVSYSVKVIVYYL